MNVTDFLTARIAEDEAEAAVLIGWDTIDGIAFGERLRAECAAKRRILDTLRSYEPSTEWDIEPDMGKRRNNAAGAVRVMAAVYGDHPDYDPEWAL